MDHVRLRALRALDRNQDPFGEAREYLEEDDAGKRFIRRHDPWLLPICRDAGREALYVCWGNGVMPGHLLLLCLRPGTRRDILAKFSETPSETGTRYADQ